jgi:hypothetical protein
MYSGALTHIEFNISNANLKCGLENPDYFQGIFPLDYPYV